jgi:hypothetical protein
MIEITKIRVNKEKQRQECEKIFINKTDVACLYKDIGGNYLLTKNGYTHKIYEDIFEVEKKLDI